MDLIAIKAVISPLQKEPESPEHTYLIPMFGILNWAFQPSDGYVSVRGSGENNGPYHDSSIITVMKTLCSPGGDPQLYDFLAVKSRGLKAGWETTVGELRSHLASRNNKLKNMYGMVQIGVQVGFYKYEETNFASLVEQLHLVKDANDVVTWLNYVKQNPLCSG